MKVKSHFFGKDCIIDRALANRNDVLEKLLEKNFQQKHLLFLNQIHSDKVVVIDSPKKIHGEQNLPKADALVTNLPQIAIAVITADCSPILAFDSENGVIAAIHAGWRGAKSGVIANAIFEMKNLGAKNITAIIGPMIQQKSYEVSKDFFDEFVLEDKANEEFFISGKNAEKYLFDLNGYVEKQLKKEGVAKIKNQKIDTYANETEFFSFRRSTHRKEQDCGRNVSVVYQFPS